MKVLDLKNDVDVSVTPPFVRTFADHETAFDFAGTKLAGQASRMEPPRQAARLEPAAAMCQ